MRRGAGTRRRAAAMFTGRTRRRDAHQSRRFSAIDFSENAFLPFPREKSTVAILFLMESPFSQVHGVYRNQSGVIDYPLD